MEHAGDIDGAIQKITKCLELTTESKDFEGQISAQNRLGDLHYNKEDYDKALEHYNCFLSLAKEINSQEDKSKACFAIAQCKKQLGDIQGAIEALENSYSLNKAGNSVEQAQACQLLGEIFLQMKNYQQAVLYFEKFFEAARALGNNKMVDKARFSLGVARGAARMDQYIGVVNNDLNLLIQWKNVRMPFYEAL
eukprot:TRINITY_DN23992_c0_g2_i1.p1 TRINITY_DN23992_c0_g2~~TRINITY_DN23992_c0_g2_i1.p1  ORF type:complete len:218 (+),score=33.82 TRINITY_DN23992_c0_g2_i1:73-654(+)